MILVMDDDESTAIVRAMKEYEANISKGADVLYWD